MTEKEVLDLKLSEHLLKLMLNENIPFEKKKGKMDYLIRMGADVNAKLYGKSMLSWVKDLNDENLIKYVKENGGIELYMPQEKMDELGRRFWNENNKPKSVKEIKELALMGANLGAKNNLRNVIWKDLSFDEINEVLKDLPKGYVIDGDVNLYKKGLTKLPDFSKVIVRGNFYCDVNKLKDLTGAPRVVGGDFKVSLNTEMVSLKGAPERVGGNFDCSWHNKLIDLSGAPESVGGKFDCSYSSQLTSLQGAPREVGGSFDCSWNQLTTLQGAPSKVGGNFDCRENQLTTLQGAPSKIEGRFDCSYNQLENLKGAPENVGEDFICSDNKKLKSLIGAPEIVGKNFDCGHNESLVNLIGAPIDVGGDFISEEVDLCSLEGKPEKVGGRFYFDKEVSETFVMENVHKLNEHKRIASERDNKRKATSFMKNFAESMNKGHD